VEGDVSTVDPAGAERGDIAEVRVIYPFQLVAGGLIVPGSTIQMGATTRMVVANCPLARRSGIAASIGQQRARVGGQTDRAPLQNERGGQELEVVADRDVNRIAPLRVLFVIGSADLKLACF